MKKSIVLAAILLLGLGLFAVCAWSQEDMEAVGSSAFENKRRPQVPFRHDEHNETAGIDDCAACHHVYDDQGKLVEDESSEDQTCAACHGLSDKGRQPGLMKAFHLNCKGCHMDKGKGPVTCGQCHIGNNPG